MRIVLLLASFAFVLSVAQARGYGRTRTRKVVKPIIKPLHKTIMHNPNPIISHKPAILPKKMPYPKKPVMPVLPKKPVLPKPGVMDPMMPMGPMGGPMVGPGLPMSIQNILGKTITGKDIIGGITSGFPRHGGAGAGARFANGLRNGWGADPRAHVDDLWRDPLDMQPFDPAFNGGNLVLDQSRGIWAAEQQHQMVKATGGAIGGPGVIEHNIGKEVNHMARKTVSGVGIATPIMDKKMGGAGSFVGLSQMGGMGPVGTAFVDPMGPIALDHNMAKSTGMGGPVGHGMAKATGGMGMGVGMGGMQHDIVKATSGVGMVGGVGMAGAVQHDMAKATMLDVDPYGSVRHDMAKSSGMGMGGMGPVVGIQHDIAKSSGMGMGMGPGAIQHDIAKSTGMGMGGPMGGMQHDIVKATTMAADPFGPAGGVMGGVGMQHDIVKATSGMGPVGGMMGPGMLPPVQVKKAGGNPVHNVEKVIRSGMTSAGHDDLAFNIGSQLARQVAHESARTIDMGSGGQVSAGNPLAASAVHGLAKEAVHVMSETIDMAAGKPGHMGAHRIDGSPIVGGGAHMMVGGSGTMMGGASFGIGGHEMMPIEPVMPMKPPMMPIKHPKIPKKPKIPKGMIKGRGYGRGHGRRKKGKGKGKGLMRAMRMRAW